jgi:hypothetical protein
MESAMTMPNKEAIKKITGNIAVEISDAAYRNVASLLITAVLERTKSRLGEHNAVSRFLDDNEDIGEAIFGFALAAILELVPMTTQMETRQRVAYNLRVKSYEEFGELLLNSTGIAQFFIGGMGLEAQLEKALRQAGVEQQAVKPVAKPNGAGQEDGSEIKATAAPVG